MIYLLDANSCIKFLNGRSENVRRRLEAKRPQDVALCAVVKAELLYGALKSARPAENLDRLRPFFERFISLPFDDAAAEIYGAIRVRLERAGTPIGPNDLFIAAIALAQGSTLVTHNTREFRRVEGLLLEDWE
jgi:tRNA(fMet)-specific endonuclease VapC